VGCRSDGGFKNGTAKDQGTGGLFKKVGGISPSERVELVEVREKKNAMDEGGDGAQVPRNAKKAPVQKQIQGK